VEEIGKTDGLEWGAGDPVLRKGPLCGLTAVTAVMIVVVSIAVTAWKIEGMQ
jgi:hypothetical protein